jgi:FtsP/CotA-like multicopper oxidase with cupredoxin domain
MQNEITAGPRPAPTLAGIRALHQNVRRIKRSSNVSYLHSGTCCLRGSKERYQMTTDRTSLQPPHTVEVEFELTKYLDPLRIPPVRKPHHELEITMRATHAQLHSELPPTPVWAYDGHFPGPTIEVRSGRNLQVTWRNEITGTYPATAVELENATPGPGRDGAEPRAEVEALPPWTVVHLHGARTGAGNDGWTENAIRRGLAQLAEYPNKQPSTTMWYHDHAMAVTALNVMAGLAGMYLIRDDEEAALHLPRGRHEIPLIVCDRNLDTDEYNEYTGDLLYKQTILPPIDVPDAMVIKVPFTGPFTLVNGVIWPHLDVDARWYRFRVLNASNSRPYTFELRDEDGAPVHGAMHQIGSDSGLLPTPAALDALTLSAAERADVLIDFRAFRGTSLTFVNTLAPPLPPDVSGSLNPDVMQFRVRSRPVHDHFRLPATLSPSFKRLTHDNLPRHEHRWLALTLLDGKHPEMWEMVEIEDDDVPPDLPVDGIVQVKLADKTVTTLQRVSRTFKDAANFYVQEDGWEQWKIINLTPVLVQVPHPIHLHLIRFQAISRDIYDVTTFNSRVGGTTTPISYQSAGTLTPGEQGWKDTIRVGNNELVSIAGEFSGGSGRYMYHCHILEHEDEGMMGTFVVMPEQVSALDPHMHDPHPDH